MKLATQVTSFVDDETREEADADDDAASRFMPTPPAAAVAVLGLLAFGALLGSATSQIAQSAGTTTFLLEAPSSTALSSPARTPTPAPTPQPVSPTPTPISAPAQPVAPVPVHTAAPGPAPTPSAPGQVPEAPTLPPVKHVFLIVLADQGYDQAFGQASPAPYLANTLRGQGELLSNYYAVAQGDLANEIALLSGQGPTPQTAANCPDYTDIAPGTTGADGQVAGSGCVYPQGTLTLPGQLTASGKQWRAYVEDIGNGGIDQSSTCRHPTLGGPDGAQAPLPGDAYETWRNPFVYFHSLIDGTECVQNDIGLDQLGPDLQAKSSTASLSYIVPNACHDGSDQPCAPGEPSGLVAADAFLQAVVPEIEASPAYKDGGLIAITFAEAPQTGLSADSSACCDTPQYPNLPTGSTPTSTTPVNGPVKPTGGGGHVGLLLISPYVTPGSVNDTGYYNHFSLLLSIEDLFDLQPLGYAADPALTAFDSSVFNAHP